MKKFIAVAIFTAFTWVAQADISLPVQKTIYDKIGRGVANVVAAPVEIVDSICEVTEAEGPIAGWTKGPTQGVARTFMDVGLGFFDLLTAPLPVGPYFTYQTWKQHPYNSTIVQDYPPSDFLACYRF
ncbi:MAG: exosortase system-associated protein, TIGR04073 family [Verrucomicrobiota bacterium]